MNLAATCLALSFLLNLLLLFLLYKTRKIIGNYRYLLMIYSVFLVSLNLLDVLILPACHIHEYGFIYFTTTSLGKRPIGLIFATLSSLSQGLCITLLSINFAYRYKTIRGGSGLTKYWQIWILISVLILVVWAFAAVFAGLPNDYFDFFFRESVLAKSGVDILTCGYFAVIYFKEGGQWYWPSIFGLCIVSLCEAITCVLIVFCGVALFENIRDASRFSSGVISRVNRDLFRTLLLQTIAPVSMIHLPGIVLIFSPLFGVRPAYIEDVQPVLMSVFPIVDTLIVLVCFRAFRNTLKELLCNTGSAVSTSTPHVATS